MEALRSLGLLLRLRAVLAWRRLVRRGALAGVFAAFGVVIGGVWALALPATAWLWASKQPPELAAAAAAAIFLLAHLPLLGEAVVRLARVEGMAAALQPFPLPTLVVLLADGLAGAASPVVLLPALLLLGVGAALPGAGALWMVVPSLWLGLLRHSLGLGLGFLLRRRGLREAAAALMSLSGVATWIGWIWLQDRVGADGVVAALRAVGPATLDLPIAWFVAPALGGRRVEAAGAVAALLGLAALSSVLLDRSLHGDPGGGGVVRRGRRRLERWPFDRLPPAVHASFVKELRVAGRDPFLLVMLLAQGVVLLLPALWMHGRAGGLGPFWLVVLLPGLLLAEQSPLFNQWGLEGRALRYLSAQPAARVQVLLGRNLAWLALLGLANGAVLVASAIALGQASVASLWAVIATAALLVLIGVGNAISVLAPMPWIGARAAAGGARAAQAASDAGATQPGCGSLLLHLAMSQAAFVIALPAAGIAVAGHLAGGAGALFGAIGALGFGALIWLAGTALALRAFPPMEERLLEIVAGVGAS